MGPEMNISRFLFLDCGRFVSSKSVIDNRMMDFVSSRRDGFGTYFYRSGVKMENGFSEDKSNWGLITYC